MAEEFLHLEHDGKLLLVNSKGDGPQIPVKGRTLAAGEKEDVIRLPTVDEVAALGITWSEKGRAILRIGDSSATVIKGHPEIVWPENWAWKDDVISDSWTHPLARESVYRSLHRLVAKVVVIDEGDRILMAKVKRGHFTGCWSLPGGYLDHDEHPQIGAAREALEELGINIEINESNTSVVEQNIFTDEGISFVSFTYRVEVQSHELEFSLKEDEIEAADWFSQSEAIAKAVSWFDLTAIEKLS